MDLSIIVPCHNLEPYITPLINSLNKQLFTYSVEIIFVCDGCKDNTYTVIDNTIDKEKFKVSIFEINFLSPGAARNHGLNRAVGDYIWFIDGDDWILECYAIQTLLHTIIYNQYPVLKFEYESEKFSTKIDCMVWQYIYKHTFIKGMGFIGWQKDEDVKWTKEIKWKLQKDPMPTIPVAFYYYNYGRPNSNTTQLREKGRVDP